MCKMTFKKIPATINDVRNWKHVRIRECGEDLVKVRRTERIETYPIYYFRKIKGARQELYLRETVYNKLVFAAKELPQNYKIAVLDAWRPESLQRELFNNYVVELKKKYPNMTYEEIELMAEKYISLPSTNHSRPSPHITGGAIDVNLINKYNEFENMGSKFDDYNTKSKTRYYEAKEERGELTKEEKLFLKNRRILFGLMTNVGFTNYSEEWWHYDYGNQFWGALKGKDAIYGATLPKNGV